MKYLDNRVLDEISLGDEMGKLSDLKLLIRERELDKELSEKFPIDNFGKELDAINVMGSKELISQFIKINDDKVDFIEKLENIEYIGLTDQDEIILNFSEDGNGIAHYDFTYDFFEELFEMGKFLKFCLKNNYRDLIKENIDQLISLMGNLEMQYRCIRHNDKLLIRGITSKRYNNYDNHLALYLGLIALHQYKKINNTQFKVINAYLRDSEIKVFFEQTKPLYINNVGTIYFGAVLSNNELKKSKLNFELRYRVVDENDNSFAATPDLKDGFFSIQHSLGIENLHSKIENLFVIKERQDKILEYIKSINKLKKLNDNDIYKIFKKIVDDRDIVGATRKEAIKIYNNDLVGNTLTLFEVFNSFSKITDDLDERLTLERIYHKLIVDLTSK